MSDPDGVELENVRLAVTNIDWTGDGNADVIEFWFEGDCLLKGLEDPQQINTSVTRADRPSNNAVMSFGGQARNVNLEFRLYNNGKNIDKSKGTMVDAHIADARIAPGAITDVDTTNDSVKTSGDHRDRVSTGDEVALDTKGQATANDGKYVVNDINYDSTEDKTEFFLDGDLTDSTAIGALSHSVVTVREQKVYLQNYIDNSNLRVQGRLYGDTFSDPDGDGNNEGTPVRVNRFRPRIQSENPMRADGMIQMDVGFSI